MLERRRCISTEDAQCRSEGGAFGNGDWDATLVIRYTTAFSCEGRAWSLLETLQAMLTINRPK